MAFCYFTAISPDTANPQLSVSDYTSATFVQRLYTFVFNFNFDTIPLWYLYMLIGLYLIMPIISCWLNQASQKEIKTVLYIWGATLFLPYIKMVAPMLGYAGNYGNNKFHSCVGTIKIPTDKGVCELKLVNLLFLLSVSLCEFCALYYIC